MLVIELLNFYVLLDASVKCLLLWWHSSSLWINFGSYLDDLYCFVLFLELGYGPCNSLSVLLKNVQLRTKKLVVLMICFTWLLHLDSLSMLLCLLNHFVLVNVLIILDREK